MIVVSNTSPITNLAAIGQLRLLETLYREIQVPTAVIDELHAEGQIWPGTREVDAAAWIRPHAVNNATNFKGADRQRRWIFEPVRREEGFCKRPAGNLPKFDHAMRNSERMSPPDGAIAVATEPRSAHLWGTNR